MMVGQILEFVCLIKNEAFGQLCNENFLLTIWGTTITRLETRTKEFNLCASLNEKGKFPKKFFSKHERQSENK